MIPFPSTNNKFSLYSPPHTTNNLTPKTQNKPNNE
jgi:hypothetical protein